MVLSEAQLALEQAEEFSIQEHDQSVHAGLLMGGISQRGPLLPAWGSRERELSLRLLSHRDYNTTFKSAIAGLIKRVQSTPWEVKAPKFWGNKWQEMLMQADFGDWDRFLAKTVLDYSRQDQGSWIEFIAPGDTRLPPVGPVVGIAVLDSLRVTPTGIPKWPAIYYDRHGKMHLMHHTRIEQFVDSNDSDERLPGIGTCSLSRAVGPVRREILISQYIETYLDDKPPPGFMLTTNLAKDEMEAALKVLEREENTDTKGEYGRTMRLYGLRPDEKPEIEFVTNVTPPEKFDYIQYSQEIKKQIATAIGIDIQEIGELTGGGIGTGTQSEILAQKSRGKAFGRILKGLERIINQALPADAQFQWKYEDPQGDAERAEVANAWSIFVQNAQGLLSNQEARELLANKVEAVQDVITDEEGVIRRFPDSDPKPDETLISDTDSTPEEAVEEDTPPTPTIQLAFGEKAFTQTAARFKREFTPMFNAIVKGEGTSAALRARMRNVLRKAGLDAFDDGLKEGGVNPKDLNATERAQRRRTVATWLAAQNAFINEFVKRFRGNDATTARATDRAQAWVNKSLRAVRYSGFKKAASEKFVRWVWNPEKEHCRTCRVLNGQVHKLKDFLDKGLFPGSASLECHGVHCGCDFKPAEGPSKGRLPGTKPVIAGLRDKLTAFLRRIFGRG
jgi:hypothetical protein